MAIMYVSIYKRIELGCVCTLLVYIYLYWTNSHSIHLASWGRTRAKQQFSSIRSDKWIVVTTIAYPNTNAQFLAAIPGWKVVVVGDTNVLIDWRFQDCVYLSMEEQHDLGFETIRHLPERISSRKTAGYLFAIAHGAKFIYETGDDNQHGYFLGRFILASTMWGLLYSGKRLFNPYRHFGQPTRRPREFPLASVGEEVTQNYTLGHWKTPSIQQGVVNGDPDMDAIFGLTRKKTASAFNVTFDSRAPPAIVPTGVFSPINSQDTLFLYDALWALLIPTTTAFRVCDIWRGYWVQRLLWEMGGNVGFFPPNAFQKRNSHSYLLDAIDEDDLYFQTDRLVDFLTAWKCKPEHSFFGCVINLSTDMFLHNFWNVDEILLTKAWITDLIHIGYEEPKRVQFGRLKMGAIAIPDKPFQEQTRSSSMDSNVTFRPREQPHPMYTRAEGMTHINNLATYCKKQSFGIPIHLTSQISNFPNILLIVVFNFPHYNNIHFLETMYRLYFPQIVYCGSGKTKFDKQSKRLLKPVSFIEVDVGNGWFSQNCLTQAMKMNYNVDGFLYVADDTLLNVWNIHKLPIDKIWFNERVVIREGVFTNWNWYNRPNVGFRAYLKALSAWRDRDKGRVDAFFKTLAKNAGYEHALIKGTTDIAYVPRRLKDDAVFFLEHFSRYNVFVEIAIPTVFGGIENNTNTFMISGRYLWYDGKRNHIEKYFNKEHIFLHPVKISNELKLAKGKKFFCNTFLPLTIAVPNNKSERDSQAVID